MGGGLKKNAEGNWHTISPGEGGDNFGVINDRWRVIAAKYLWDKDKSQVILALGGQGQLKGQLPESVTVASVIKGELMDLGVPEENIIEEKESENTFEQLKVVLKHISKGFFDSVIILSNEWHLDRVRAMIDYGPIDKEFRNISREKLKFISAEEVMLSNDPQKWEEIINKVRESSEMKDREEKEKRGVIQIKEGTYRFI